MSTNTATKSDTHAPPARARPAARASADSAATKEKVAHARSRSCLSFQSGGGGSSANMPKKKGEYSVLSEVNTEDEWIQLCKKEVKGARVRRAAD